MSTANLFSLPMGCHYGVGSPSFGAWRELAANVMATGLVRDGRADGFPLLHHWRVLDGPPDVALRSDELADVERMVEYWHGSGAVRERLEAIARASATVALFLEHIPHPLPAWLHAQMGRDDDADAALAMVDTNLRREVASMNAAGLFHFDAHFGNLLTDGDDLYLTDFGLATSSQFELASDESTFLAANLSHDACHTVTRLVDWLVTELTPVADVDARDELIRAVAAGHELLDLLPSAASIITRAAPIAVVVNAFYRRLHREDRRAAYPTEAIDRACAVAGFPRPWR